MRRKITQVVEKKEQTEQDFQNDNICHTWISKIDGFASEPWTFEDSGANGTVGSGFSNAHVSVGSPVETNPSVTSRVSSNLPKHQMGLAKLYFLYGETLKHWTRILATSI